LVFGWQHFIFAAEFEEVYDLLLIPNKQRVLTL